MAARLVPVPDGLVGERVDVALARMLGLSRSRAADLAAVGAVLLDGRVVGKSDRIAGGSWLEVDVPDSPVVAPEPEPVEGMTIVYEDTDVVIVDKPAGVAAHPSLGWTGPTVIGALAAAGYRISTSGPPERQGIVHRLDVGTSGLMAVAKSEAAYSGLKRAFRRRTVVKVYHALVQGHPEPTEGTIDAPIGRHPGSEWKFAVVAGGRHSVTHYDTLEMLPSASLVEVHLETGRTHQIRVHFTAVRHPLVADLTYGADPVLAARVGVDRQWLHAVRLGFEQPVTGEWLEVTSSYPDDLMAALGVLRAG
jgi:23S rRNA pseudouridine1911/1915/1917 synthase